MRSLFTRAAQHKKGHRLTPVAFAILAAAIFVVFNTSTGNTAYRASAESTKNIVTGSLPPTSTLVDEHTFVRHTAKGNEGLDLAARLTASGGFITRPVGWQIFERDADLGLVGRKVLSDKTPVMEAKLQPGAYRIKVNYGFASASRDITILPQSRVGVTFILNVGGVRTLSRVAGMNAAQHGNAHHSIIALPDNKPEKLITENVAQGETIRLSAGQYRIESRFENGNTLAIANVTIKPGILTSLNIDHQAALAKLALLSANNKSVNWSVFSIKGKWTKTGKNKNPAMILTPGRYVFSANIGNDKFSRTVSLAQGKETTIILGN